jgi:hypothetical protein
LSFEEDVCISKDVGHFKWNEGLLRSLKIVDDFHKDVLFKPSVCVFFSKSRNRGPWELIKMLTISKRQSTHNSQFDKFFMADCTQVGKSLRFLSKYSLIEVGGTKFAFSAIQDPFT